MRAGPINWPTPSAIPFGPLVNYGFSDRVVLPIEIRVPASAQLGERLSLIANVRWLECADICIPGEARVGVTVTVADVGLDSADAPQIAKARSNLPAPYPGTARLTDLGAAGLQLVLQGVDTPSTAYFFPYEVKLGALIDFAQPQKLVRGKDGFGLTLIKSPSFPAELSGPVGGVLVLGNGARAKAYEIGAEFEAAATPNAAPQSDPSPSVTVPIPPPTSSLGLFGALGLAFLGGLILNLMPCVFPILSMKALGLLDAAHGDRRTARSHGLLYGAGVMISFLALAGLLIGLSAAGNAVGWGFQLQSPVIVLVLAMVMALIGFNLMGFFQIGTSLQGVGGSHVRSGQSLGGSFLTGVLAVVVAAPCTAPFMGAALGFAAIQTPPIALLVFAALGAGFAAPFVVLTFTPALMSALPKPGLWMVRLREALAFPMFATAIWLIWVLSAQTGQTGVLAALIGVFGTGVAIWLARTWPGTIGKGAGLFVFVATLAWAGFHIARAPVAAPNENVQNDAGRWSAQRVVDLQAQGKTVFVNFTADWCVTCKVNEMSVFANTDVAAALNSDKVVYLVADWTKRDEAIAKALASRGRVGVPLYLVYTPKAAAPKILPQILTAQIVLDALN